MFYISYLICDVLPNNKVYTRDLNDLSNTVRRFKLYFGVDSFFAEASNLTFVYSIQFIHKT